ncbi:flavonol synthase [Candidatus Phycosocius spiralis]|uniref:2-oxoglutarate-dependent ethylene/succinate-forming enzyme n=2 Tax=Candidatus Phycosocius spiralis TaxID=2815099 RepID=A0ABQ4PWC9_9PROT|nr:flavonol synthase [Candidatus Phycosocius spiralis]
MKLYKEDFAGFSQELGSWFVGFGFAIVSDHGVEKSIIDHALDQAKAFFALPLETKARYTVKGGSGQRGYTGLGVETAKDHTFADLKEFWHHGRTLPDGHRYNAMMPANVAMPEIPGFDASQQAMFEAFDALGKQILRAIAMFLALPIDYFDEKVALGNSVLRTLHYPALEAGVTPGAIRAGAHGDINVITLLLGAQEPGLQLLDKEGNWQSVTAPEGCVVINIGDMLARLTNDLLPSTIHRVINPMPERAGIARYSAPFFLHFSPDVLIKTLPMNGPPNYKPIRAQDFLEERLREIKLA